MQTRLKTFLVFIIIIATASLSVTAQNKSNKFIVVLDAGHGGKDPGNRGNGYYEKKIALNIILKVGAALEKLPDFKVIYTRKTDVFVELRERAAIANRVDADLFVSVHCDSHTSQAHGAGTFVMSLSKSSQNLSTAKKENEVIYLEDNYEVKYAGFNPDKPETLIGISAIAEENLDNSILVANSIQERMVSLKRKNRKVKQDVFWVLHNTYMPSVLVETGFLTYKREGAYLNTKKGQTEMAKAIKDGIVSYKKKIDGNFVDSNFIINQDDKTETINVEKPQIPSEEKIIPNTFFKVQIAAGFNKIATKSYNFKGLKEISRIKVGKLYKYFYGNTSSINAIKKMQTEAQQKGFKSAFIVAYKEGKRITLQEALNSGTE